MAPPIDQALLEPVPAPRWSPEEIQTDTDQTGLIARYAAALRAANARIEAIAEEVRSWQAKHPFD